MRISQKQVDAISSLPGPQRYAHFIKVAADQGRIWGLYFNGWALAAAEDEMAVLPVWPTEPYALQFANKEWAGYEATKIELPELFDDLLPRLRERKTLLGVFYTPTNKGVMPSLEQIEFDLRNELSRIE